MPTPHRPSRLLWFLTILSAWVVAGPRAGADFGADEYDWGPVISRLQDANGDLRTRAVGPVFERARSERGDRFWAVRPLVCGGRDATGERSFGEMLWPVAQTRRFQDQRMTRVLVAFYTDFDVRDPRSRYRFMILPVYFQGRDRHGASYRAVFPLGGRIHEFLWQDAIAFVLFPVYVRSTVNEVETRSVLWPIFSRTRGKGISRFRVFPLYGYARHRARFEKGFVLWPFFTWARYTYPDARGRAYIVFPLWGRFRMPDQRATLILPPFFRFSRGERMDYSYCPWPFFQRSRGQIERLYLWPLWGRRTQPGVRSTFWLWPIFRSERIDRGRSVRYWFRAFPFYYSVLEKARGPDGRPAEVTARRHLLWPLGSYRREGDARRWRLLELWPLPESAPVERNWAPWWTWWTHTGVGQNADTELLWGLYRHRRRGTECRAVSVFPVWEWRRDDRGPAVREWSVLKGLLGRRREADVVSYRFLYFIRLQGREEKKP